MIDPRQKARQLAAARLEQSRRAASRMATAAFLQSQEIASRRINAATSKLEWLQRERKPPNRAPGQAAWPSRRQWGRLAIELSYENADGSIRYPTRAETRAWVRMANAYLPEPYTAVHLVMALDLAITGRNVYGTTEQLIAYSWGEELPPPDRRRMYRHKKARRV